jgi:hypothetical protein
MTVVNFCIPELIVKLSPGIGLFPYVKFRIRKATITGIGLLNHPVKYNGF